MSKAAEIKYVTVFEKVLNVKSLSSYGTTKTFKCPQYPLNEFKLKGTNYDTHVRMEFYISGPINSNFHVKISKKNGKSESEEFDLSEKTSAEWTFDTSKCLVEEPWRKYSYMCVVDLKVEFSVPPNLELKAIEPVTHFEVFNNPIFSDFKICVKNMTFHVSKGVLAMNSKVLGSKILELAGKQQDKLVIDDLDLCVTQTMLEFMYDNTINLGKDIQFIDQLLVAAGKYDVEKLKVRCEAILLDNINISTACRYFAIAEHYKCLKLRKKTINYFRSKHKELFNREEFKELIRTYPNLSEEICSHSIKHKTKELFSSLF